MLLGEDLGRRHDGALKPALESRGQRLSGDQGLAAPHVALEEAEHRMRALEVGQDLAERPFLGGGRSEGDQVAKQGVQAVVEVVAVGAPGAGLAPAPESQGELELQQLAIDQPAVSRGVASRESS